MYEIMVAYKIYIEQKRQEPDKSLPFNAITTLFNLHHPHKLPHQD
jgi:hypothetical protein